MCLPLLAAIPAAIGSISSAAAGAASAVAGALGAGGMALTSTAVTAGAAGLSYASQSAQASAQNRMAVAVAHNANGSYLAQTAAVNSRLLQQRDAAYQQEQGVQINALKAEGRAKAASAEGGVSGVGLDGILNDIEGQRGRALSAIGYNYKTDQADAGTEITNSYYQAKDRASSVPLGVSPSLAMPILDTAGAGLSAMGKYGFVKTYPSNPNG